MRLRKFLSAALSAAILCGLLTVAPAQAASTGFVDIPDPDVAEAAALLQIMEVVDGNGYGYFFPEMNLTRAQFCKMAVNIRGEGSKAEAQQNRTIFLDVPATHWGRGYINYASSVTVVENGERLVMGVGDGTFHPDENIAFDQAVTMTMRLLGYTAGDVATGATWYDGYLSMAKTIELLDGLENIPHDAPLTRAQAAILFRNLLFTESKGSDKTFLASLGGSETEGSVVLNVDAKADDGKPAVETTKGTYKTDRVFAASLEGKEGKVVLDKDSKLIAFVPKAGTTSKTVNVASTEATFLMASGGEKLTVEPETVVYWEGKATTWKDSYLTVGTEVPIPAAFHYGADGKLSHLFFSAKDPEGITSMVARRVPGGGNPFTSLTGGSAYTMYKNGLPATAADIRQYDVATYDAGTHVLQVSDLKLTGVYETASPSPKAPVTITVMGHPFPVLSTARDDLDNFKIGDKITLLLTADNQVAGAVSPDAVRNDAVGVATVSGETATVKLLQGGLEVSGAVSAGAAGRYNNQLVRVTSGSVGRLSLSVVSGASVSADLDVSGRTLGDRAVAENVAVYDRVENGAIVSLDYNDLALSTIPRKKISFAGYDYAGRVKYLVLNDATGDAYTYGYFSYEPPTGGDPIYGDDSDPTKVTGYTDIKSGTLCVKHAGENGADAFSAKANYSESIRNRAPGGVAYTVDGKIAAVVKLTALKDVSRATFDSDGMAVTVSGTTYPVSENVQCYNKTTKTWLASGEEGMKAARAYSDSMTLYYDRAPQDGGKIRLVEVE